jgi:ubiquitin-protein ligase
MTINQMKKVFCSQDVLAMSAAAKRIAKEVRDLAASPPAGASFELSDEERSENPRFAGVWRSPLLGALAHTMLELYITFPSDYPFKPPAFEIRDEALAERCRLVCPELMCWHDVSVPTKLRFEAHDASGCGSEAGTSWWSPSLTVSRLAQLAAVRMSSPSLAEAVEPIVSAAPRVATGGVAGTVVVVFGSAGEPPPAPRDPAAGPHLFVLVDPSWATTGLAMAPAEFEAARMHELARWSAPARSAGEETHHVALAAPYCCGDPPSVAALRAMLDGLRERGWRHVVLRVVGGIELSLPTDVPGLEPISAAQFEERFGGAARSSPWEGAPAWLRRREVGVTRGNYSGAPAPAIRFEGSNEDQ